MSRRYKLKRRQRYYVQHGQRRVLFLCEACEAAGYVENPAPMESILCDCGARYLHWPDGFWKCVVRPFYVSETQSAPHMAL